MDRLLAPPIESPDADTVAEVVDAAAAEPMARLRETGARLEAIVINQPVLALGIAVGIGFVIARALPR